MFKLLQDGVVCGYYTDEVVARRVAAAFDGVSVEPVVADKFDVPEGCVAYEVYFNVDGPLVSRCVRMDCFVGIKTCAYVPHIGVYVFARDVTAAIVAARIILDQWQMQGRPGDLYAGRLP